MLDKPNGNWVKVSREVFYHELANDKPWDRLVTWIYLIAMASTSGRTVQFRGHEYILKRGQLAISQGTLEDRAGWSRERVRSFFRYLVQKEMIEISSNQFCTVITVLNYGKWQGESQPSVCQKNNHESNQANNHESNQANINTEDGVGRTNNLVHSPVNSLAGDQQNKNDIQEVSRKEIKDLKSSPLSKSSDQTNFQGFQDAWTSICVSAGLHGVRDWTTWHERVKGAWNRIAASKDPSWSALSPLERICDLFTHAARISFLSGDNNRKWKADLEFVLRPLSIDRIMGDYYCDAMQAEPLKLKPVPRTEEQDRLQRERGLAWLDPSNVKEEVKDER